MNMEQFAQNLRIFRLAKGYTQQEMSLQLNIRRQTYSNYENGKRLPNLEILLAIKSILGISMEQLVADVAGPVNPKEGKDIIEPAVLHKLVQDYQSLPKSARKEVLNFIAFQKSSNSKSTLL